MPTPPSDPVLADRESHLRSVIDNVPALIAFVDTEQRYGFVNAHYQAAFAPGQPDLAGRTVREVLGESRYAIAQPLIERALRGEPTTYDWEPFPGIWQVIQYAPKLGASGQVEGYYVLGTDITERRKMEAALRASEAQLSRVLEGSDQGFWDWNLQTNTFQVSARWETMLGYQPGEMQVDVHEWSKLIHPDDLPKALRSIEQHMGGHAPHHEFELRARTKDGGWRWILTRGGVVQRDPDGKPLMMSGTHTDITRAKAHESELDHVAHYDVLTGLPNRRLLSDRLQQTILRADRHGWQSAVCVLDLDDFKQLNERHGREVGDRFLQALAGSIKAVLRGEDTLARLGGDEFVVLLSALGSAEDGAQVLDRILDTLRQPIQVGEHRLSTTASIGVSLYPADPVDPDTLLRHADQAMLLAKQGGKNRYQLFDPEIDRLAQHRLEQLQRLEVALAQDEFTLFYQPKVDLVTGQVIGAEALIRWRHPERGLLALGEFLPYLHGSDLERPLGEWVIGTALRQIEAWAAAGLEMPISVNVSAHHLMQPDFHDRLALTLGCCPGVKPSSLELEVLETAAIADMRQAVDTLHRCIALGVGFSLDDFGTGYSSLTYLRQLPVKTLKIDQSFVRDMLTDQDDLGIVQGVIQLAAAFHRRVIAEGVETMEHGAALRALGCHLAQGYGIARPMPAADLPGWCLGWARDGFWRRL